MKIVLIRHGESEGDLLHVHEGSADFNLTEMGHWQAEQMAQRVAKEFNPERIWVSSLKRARQTAQKIADITGWPIEVLEDLQEHKNGDIAGKPLDEIPFPFSYDRHEKWGVTGESEIEFRARCEQVLSQIFASSKQEETVMIVAHGGVISRLIESMLNMPFSHPAYFRTGDTGIHLLEKDESGKIAVHYLNHTSHLTKPSC
ncbi:histidine phosphatase family protein [Jeotgalibacillus sp. R-1-5s-1]|uniref:histidine phosphatase family protein n=1 Tax=Jeotgalibacillus sp. R-1-5s-1 TaxID=2555897 RepID=UPI0010697329|nr:histidine phosphatase family protein [Jeotgalibacillus sp. R-1-5s-1]TFE00836.1 histidine phosphatase family protein [Jeotgalibacillus sp. R-1-5s-1]